MRRPKNHYMTKTPKGDWTIDQPTINGWLTSYNPETDSVCMHGAEGEIVRSWAMHDKMGKPSTRGWDNLLYVALRQPAPCYREDCTLEQGQYPLDGDSLVDILSR